MRHVMKVCVIVAMFTPFAAYVFYQLTMHPHTRNIFSLNPMDQLLMAVLLLLPLLGLRQLALFPNAKDIPSEFE